MKEDGRTRFGTRFLGRGKMDRLAALPDAKHYYSYQRQDEGLPCLLSDTLEKSGAAQRFLPDPTPILSLLYINIIMARPLKDLYSFTYFLWPGQLQCLSSVAGNESLRD